MALRSTPTTSCKTTSWCSGAAAGPRDGSSIAISVSDLAGDLCRQEYSDLFGIGGGWAQPANPNLRDQYIFETFYRSQLTPQFAVTPDVQWILHPTLNPNTGSIWVASLRALYLLSRQSRWLQAMEKGRKMKTIDRRKLLGAIVCAAAAGIALAPAALEAMPIDSSVRDGLPDAVEKAQVVVVNPRRRRRRRVCWWHRGRRVCGWRWV